MSSFNSLALRNASARDKMPGTLFPFSSIKTIWAAVIFSFRRRIATGDLMVKVSRMRSFLSKGHPVRLIYISKNPDASIFFPLLQKCVDELALDGHVEEGSLTPTKHYVSLQPLGEKRRSALYATLTPEQKSKFGVEQDEKGTWYQKGRAEEGEQDGKEEEAEEDEEADEDDDAAPAQKQASAAAPQAAKSATQPAAKAAASAPAASNGKKEKKHQKQKPAWMSAPPIFSKAALQAQEKQQQQQQQGR